MNRTTTTLQIFTGFVALVGTPVMMVAGFTMFGTFAAARFRIYDMTTDYAAGVITALVLLALIYFWPVPAAHRRVLVLLWLVRTGVTPRIMLVFVPGYKIDAPLRLWARGDIPPPR